MAKKSTMKDLNGNIINLVDETDGGWIIRGRQVVNQEKWDALVKKEQDRIEASKAAANAIASPNAEIRNQSPEVARQELSKVNDLEKRIDAQDKKLDAILEALKK